MQARTLHTQRYTAQIFYKETQGFYPAFANQCYGPESDFSAELERLHEQRCAVMSEPEFNPVIPSVSKGPVLFAGYDAEWLDISPAWMREPLRALSYQFHLIGVAGEMALIFYPRSGDVADRLSFREMFDVIVREARSTGIIIEYPSAVVVSGFFLRADLAMLADLASFKHELKNIGGKISTAGRPIDFDGGYARRDIERLDNTRSLSFEEGGVCYTVPVHFYDIAKHVPAGANLEAVGALLGLPKLKIPEGFSIARMDELLKHEPASFEAYALRDAEIAVRYYLSVLDFARQHVFGAQEQDQALIPASAGAMAVKMSRRCMKAAGFDPMQVFGLEKQTVTEWNVAHGKVRTRKQDVVAADRKFHEQMAIDCYHGGRNETFAVGPMPPGQWSDLDLVGAYTTGMLSLRPLRFEASYETRDEKAFTEGVIGFARVRFCFPETVRFPCLPVRVNDQGLKYPLAGESFCTAPEISLALKLGARVDVLRGVIYPMDEEAPPIFQGFVQEIRNLRARYSQPDEVLMNAYAKLLGNSVYGKTGQGLKGKRAFDTESDESHGIPLSQISCGPMAAYVTGFVRAVLSELINRIPAHRTVVSCTTDGFMSDATASELDLSGPLCQRFQALCELVDGKGAVMLKEKHRVQQPLSMKTRACSTLIPGNLTPEEREAKIKPVFLAKGGISPPPDCADHNAHLIQLYLRRSPGQKTLMRPFVSVRDQWLKELDVFRLARMVTMNLEYDMKREPINFRMADTPFGAHVAFDTRPWKMVEQANLVRAIFDGWRKSHCLKTLEDVAHWEEFRRTAASVKSAKKKGDGAAMNLTADGAMGVLRRTLLRAYTRSMWGLDAAAYSQVGIAERLSVLGLPTTKDHVKNASRKGCDPAPHSVPRLPEIEAILARLREEDFPELQVDMLLAPAGET